MGLMFVSTIIFAQRHGSHRDSTGVQHLERMKTELLLTDNQYTQVKMIETKFAATRNKVKADTALTVGTMRNRMKKIETEREVQLKKVLTEPQWTKWTSARTKHVSDSKKHGHRHGRKDHKG